jgi:adenosylmethionine---8-amino-7-oxononanoate aminotransferase
VNTKSLQDKDKKYCWHPFAQMKGWLEEDPLVITGGKGVYLWDSDGNKYIDGVSSLWVTVHGHRHRHLDRAVKKQLKKIAHTTQLGLANDRAVELAEKLVEIAPPGLEKVFYSDSGSTAVEIAVKMAYQYWQQHPQKKFHSKKKFISLTNAYHGDTVGSVSIGGMALFHKIFKELLFKVVHISNVNALEKILKKDNKKIAGLVVEPLVQGAAGMLLQPAGFLTKVRQLCDRYNVLLICDEVATGFGRTGTMFACQQEAVVPDLMAVAKGLTGGYLPLAATMARTKIFKNFLGSFESKKTFFHGHTYTGNPLACAAALANLEVFKKEKTLEKLQPKIAFLEAELQKFWQLKHVGDIRQLGFMVGLELFQNVQKKKSYPYKKRIGHQIILEARRQGVIIRPLGDTIILMPPLSISKKELGKLLSAVYNSIKNITE